MPLVLIHGRGADARMWDPVLDRLRAEHEVLAVDLSGLDDPVRAAREVESLVAGREPVHACGHDLGAWVALEMARAGTVATVTCVCPAGLWGTAPESASIQEVGEVRVPITVGWGERDEVVPPRRLHAVGVENETLEGCGHDPVEDAPGRVAELILKGASR